MQHNLETRIVKNHHYRMIDGKRYLYHWRIQVKESSQAAWKNFGAAITKSGAGQILKNIKTEFGAIKKLNVKLPT